jgi:hypothetical protein
MKYFNWQKLHKMAYSRKYRWDEDLNSLPLTKSSSSLEAIRVQAWQELVRICTHKELAALVKLARQYETGERVPDSRVLDPNLS